MTWEGPGQTVAHGLPASLGNLGKAFHCWDSGLLPLDEGGSTRSTWRIYKQKNSVRKDTLATIQVMRSFVIAADDCHKGVLLIYVYKICRLEVASGIEMKFSHASLQRIQVRDMDLRCCMVDEPNCWSWSTSMRALSMMKQDILNLCPNCRVSSA